MVTLRRLTAGADGTQQPSPNAVIGTPEYHFTTLSSVQHQNTGTRSYIAPRNLDSGCIGISLLGLD